MTCPCGEAHPHEAAYRTTADGIKVVVWSDGAVTALMGYRLRGVPVARPRTDAAVERSRRVGLMFANEVGWYDADEVGPLFEACRWVVARGGDERDLRARLREQKRPRVSVVWTPTRTDRSGRVLERYAQLPRLFWPRMVVWDWMHSAGPERGRYEVCHVTAAAHGHADNTVVGSNGPRFATWPEVEAHLHELRGTR